MFNFKAKGWKKSVYESRTFVSNFQLRFQYKPSPCNFSMKKIFSWKTTFSELHIPPIRQSSLFAQFSLAQ